MSRHSSRRVPRAFGLLFLLPACSTVPPVGLGLADASLASIDMPVAGQRPAGPTAGLPGEPTTGPTAGRAVPGLQWIAAHEDGGQLELPSSTLSSFPEAQDKHQDKYADEDRRPTRRSFGDHPRGHFAFSFGLVDFEHEEVDATGATVLDDNERAAIAKFEFERLRRGFGGGVNLEIVSVRDDLHDNQPGITSSDTDSWEVFGHFTARPVAGKVFRMPIRFGPFMHYLNQELRGTNPDDLTYFTLGVRVEVEPEIDIFRTDDQALSVFWGGKVFTGATIVDLETTTLDEEFETTVSGYGLTTGVRFSARRLFSQIAYVRNFRRFDESDAENVGGSFVTANEADVAYDGLMFSIGVRW